MTGVKQKGLRTIALFQDLLSCGVVVSQRIARVTVLVQDVRVGDLVFQAPRHAHVRLWRIEASAGRCADDLSSKSSQDIHLYRKIICVVTIVLKMFSLFRRKRWVVLTSLTSQSDWFNMTQLTFSMLIFSGMTMMQR